MGDSLGTDPYGVNTAPRELTGLSGAIVCLLEKLDNSLPTVHPHAMPEPRSRQKKGVYILSRPRENQPSS